MDKSTQTETVQRERAETVELCFHKNVVMKAADVGSGFLCMLAMIGTRGLKDKYHLRT